MSDAPSLAGVTAVTDYTGADDFTKKHTPFVELADVDGKTVVTVTVGKDIAHPNQPDHFIGSIELFAAGASIARFELMPAVAFPKVSIVVDVAPGTEITATESCNLHGVFSMSVTR
jgi:superoxide reductase